MMTITAFETEHAVCNSGLVYSRETVSPDGGHSTYTTQFVFCSDCCVSAEARILYAWPSAMATDGVRTVSEMIEWAVRNKKTYLPVKTLQSDWDMGGHPIENDLLVFEDGFEGGVFFKLIYDVPSFEVMELNKFQNLVRLPDGEFVKRKETLILVSPEGTYTIC